MDALAALMTRRSVRQFDGRPVPREELEKIVDAARMATTARNEQPWEFIVVTQPERLRAFATLTDYGRFMAGGGACILVFCKDTKYYLEDGCTATENILVAATALGIQSCWVAGDKKSYAPAVAKLAGMPEGYKLISMVVLGYGTKPAPMPKKRDLKTVLHWDHF